MARFFPGSIGGYILLALVFTVSPASPNPRAGTGRAFIPLIHTPRMRKADPAGGRRRKARVQHPVDWGKLHPRGGIPWI